MGIEQKLKEGSDASKGPFQDPAKIFRRWAEEELLERHPSARGEIAKIFRFSRDEYERMHALRIYAEAKEGKGIHPFVASFLAEKIVEAPQQCHIPLEMFFSIVARRWGNESLKFSSSIPEFFKFLVEAWESSSTRESPFSYIYSIANKASQGLLLHISAMRESFEEILRMLKAWDLMPGEPGKVIPLDSPNTEDVLLWGISKMFLESRTDVEKRKVLEAAMECANRSERKERLLEAIRIIKIVEEKWSEEDSASPYSHIAAAVRDLPLEDVAWMRKDISQARREIVYSRAKYHHELSKIKKCKEVI